MTMTVTREGKNTNVRMENVEGDLIIEPTTDGPKVTFTRDGVRVAFTLPPENARQVAEGLLAALEG